MSIYEIRVQGRLDQHWAAWFEGLTLTYDGDCTVLRGPLTDDAALYGVLAKVRDLHVRLLSVNAVAGGESAPGTAVAAESQARPLDASPGDAPEDVMDGAPEQPRKERRSAHVNDHSDGTSR